MHRMCVDTHFAGRLASMLQRHIHWSQIYNGDEGNGGSIKTLKNALGLELILHRSYKVFDEWFGKDIL